MPLQQCRKSNQSGWKWGTSGRCYIGIGAKSRAQRQGRAIETANVKHRHPVPSNPLKADPTRTITLRRQFEQEILKRFNRLKSKILRLVIDEDAFGLKRINRVFGSITDVRFGTFGVGNVGSRGIGDLVWDDSRSPVANTRWRFQTDPQKVESFRQWLQDQVTADIVPLQPGPDRYWERFVEEGYRKGAGRAFTDVRKPALQSNLDFFNGTQEEFLRQSFARPVAIEKVQLLAGRVFTELKGVTEVMAQQVTRVLTDGLARGANPFEIARDLNNRVEKIGKTRARIIARTEIIRAHAEGQLDALEQLGVTEVGVMVEWSTAGDDRVCARCEPMDGVVFKIKEARGLIPLHPQCRCAHIPANIGESTKGQKRSQAEIEKAIDDSIRAEIPKGSKRSLAEQKRLTTTPLADKKIAKKRPKSVLDKPEAKAVKAPKPKAAPQPITKAPPTPTLPKPKLRTPEARGFSESVQSGLSVQPKSALKISQEINQEFSKTRRELVRLVKQGDVEKIGTNYRLKPVKRLKSKTAWKESLTKAEEAGLNRYTGGIYDVIRNCQAQHLDCDFEMLGFQISDIERALRRAPQFEGTSFRGLNFKTKEARAKFVAEVRKSNGLVDQAFTSTSRTKSVAVEFTEGDSPGVLFEIKGKSGVDVKSVSVKPNEDEILFQAGVRFKLKEIKDGPDQLIIMVMEEI